MFENMTLSVEEVCCEPSVLTGKAAEDGLGGSVAAGGCDESVDAALVVVEQLLGDVKADMTEFAQLAGDAENRCVRKGVDG